jgi:Tat protein secretion system quality control protein TatD with DNase activity
LVQVTPLVIDDSLVAMCQIVADVKGWPLQEAAEKLQANFNAFYQQQL